MRRFHFADLPTFNSWRRAHGLPAADLDQLPAIGFIVEGVAAGFLLRTESRSVALLDSFVTNPIAPLRERHRAVAALAERVCQEAKSRGIRQLGAFTKSRSLVSVAERLGFRSGDLFQAVHKELS